MSTPDSQKSQENPGGNTKTPGNQAYCWCFTWSEALEDDKKLSASQLSQVLKPYCKKFTFQLENSKSGYRHFQGQFSLIRKETLSTLKNIFGCKPHFEKTRDYFASLNYTTKDETRVGGPWNEKSTFLKLITDLYPWQIKARNLLTANPDDDRTINWFYDPEGSKGKTQFCKYMAATYGAQILGNGAFADLAYAIGDEPKIVLFNITRDLEGRFNYSALEAIKDGLMFSGKYESCTKLFNSPQVAVFANFSPRLESMSKDRWNIIRL